MLMHLHFPLKKVANIASASLRSGLHMRSPLFPLPVSPAFAYNLSVIVDKMFAVSVIWLWACMECAFWQSSSLLLLLLMAPLQIGPKISFFNNHPELKLFRRWCYYGLRFSSVVSAYNCCLRTGLGEIFCIGPAISDRGSTRFDRDESCLLHTVHSLAVHDLPAGMFKTRRQDASWPLLAGLLRRHLTWRQLFSLHVMLLVLKRKIGKIGVMTAGQIIKSSISGSQPLNKWLITSTHFHCMT